MADFVITIVAHGEDSIGEREVMLGEAVTTEIAMALLADGFTVDDISVEID